MNFQVHLRGRLQALLGPTPVWAYISSAYGVWQLVALGLDFMHNLTIHSANIVCFAGRGTFIECHWRAFLKCTFLL
jgi:hypothetical protein